MKNLFIVLFIWIFSVGLIAQQLPGKNHSTLNINCKSCHVCEVPTKDDPCLVACPREKYITVFQKPEQTPEVIVIDQLSDRYGAVYFSHKIHAQMSEMSGGCQSCHHFNTLGPILKCNSCHESNRKREDIRLPDLKGAFHRQCVDCHREWSHSTGCNSCHELKRNIKESNLESVKKKYTGKEHPVLLPPARITYQTNSDRGKIVTFYHDDHTSKFGLSCINCHKQESCTKCHDVNRTSLEKKIVTTKKTFEDQHRNCISCHSKDEKCSKCHGDKILERFDHAQRTGWALNRFHINLSCGKCHGSKLPYQKLDNKCLSCHNNWSSENFKHSITGLQLDETHAEMNCEDCHSEKNFEIKPSCDGCHEGYTYPKNKPGKLVGKK